jgi:hypothetical protein
MNLEIYLARAHILTQERHKDVVPQEVLHRHANDERFKSLLAGRVAFGWQQEGYDIGKMGFIPTGWYD